MCDIMRPWLKRRNQIALFFLKTPMQFVLFTQIALEFYRQEPKQP